jgi:hypothetical protein
MTRPPEEDVMLTKNTRVIISHSEYDKKIAGLVSRLLVDAFGLDKEEILCSSAIGQGLPSGNIDDKIKEKIEVIEVFIWLISSNSIGSAYVNFELGIGVGCGKCDKILPLLVDKTDISKLSGPLAKKKHLKCYDRNNMLELISDCSRLIGKPQKPPLNYQETLDQLLHDTVNIELNRINDGAFSFTPNGRALAVGAHWDDLLLGCLGTLLKLKNKYNFSIDILVICNSYPHGYWDNNKDPIKLLQSVDEIYKTICEKEGFNNITKKLRKYCQENVEEIKDRDFRANYKFIKDYIKILKDSCSGAPYNLILSPPTNDRNTDHAITAELLFTTFRNPINVIMEYDIKRYTENPSVPTLCVGLDDIYGNDEDGNEVSMAQRKVNLLQKECKIALENGHSTSCISPPCTVCVIENSTHCFSTQALEARMLINAQDAGKNRHVDYAEIFYGRIEL